MALRQVLTLVLAGSTFLAALSAEAYERPVVGSIRGGGIDQGGGVVGGIGGIGDGGYGNGGYDDVDGGFGRGGIGEGPLPPGYGDQDGVVDEKTVFLNRRFANEEIGLRQLLGIERNYRGYEVQQVIVHTRQAGPRAMLRLLVNGYEEDRADYLSNVITMVPRYNRILDQEIQSLRLRVDGQVHIESITVLLVARDQYQQPGRPGRPHQPGRPPGPVRPDRPEAPGRDEVVVLPVRSVLSGNGQLELTRYIDMYRYRGYRLVSVEVEAVALYRAALLDLYINGMAVGGTQTLDRSVRNLSFVPRHAILGQGADSLVLYSRGDLEVRQVRLVISRR